MSGRARVTVVEIVGPVDGKVEGGRIVRVPAVGMLSCEKKPVRKGLQKHGCFFGFPRKIGKLHTPGW